MSKPKRKSCIKDNTKNLRMEFKVNDLVVEVEQRKLSMLEVQTLENTQVDIFEDYEVYESMMIHDEVVLQNKQIKERVRNKYLKMFKEIDGYDDLMSGISTEPIQEINDLTIQMNEEIDSSLTRIDTKTLFIIENAKKKINKKEGEIKTNIIAFSTSKNKIYGGYFKVNGVIQEGYDLIDFINSLEPNLYNELHINALKSQYPSEEEIEDVK